jgi:rubrerythrin/predicted phosphodiesterase
MIKVNEEAMALPPVTHFAVMGDPGCDGLGTEIMSIFDAACHEATGDFILIVGDIVPEGTDRLYQNVINMVDAETKPPVYMLAGNHDTRDYETYFGRKNYYLYDNKMLLIVLDNSRRAFTKESLELLAQAITHERDNILLAFHYPPPNHYTGNSVSQEEWGKVEAIIAPVREKVRYILCGHIHSYFEDDIDGIKLIATGGGGARIEEIESVSAPYHHFVAFTFDSSGMLTHTFKPVTHAYPSVVSSEVLEMLKEAFAGECMAFMKYKLHAEDALRKNKPHLAKLFNAAAESEFFHARNFYFVMTGLSSLDTALTEGAEREADEVNRLYLKGETLAKAHRAGLAEYAFSDARRAERVHLRLLNEAKEMLAENEDIIDRLYFICTSCGYTFADQPNKTRCTVCGAPPDKIM